MSEAQHHHPHSETDLPPPIPIDSKRRPAEVIPFPKRDEEVDAEKLDFSDAPPEVAVEFLMSELSHPSRNHHKGMELVTDIEQLVPIKTEKPLDLTSLEGRLTEIVRTDALGSDELYDHKIDHDEVFQLLSDKLLSTRDRRDMRPQFDAIRNLAQLRGTVDDETDKDKEWRDVIDRLLS